MDSNRSIDRTLPLRLVELNRADEITDSPWNLSNQTNLLRLDFAVPTLNKRKPTRCNLEYGK